MNSLSGMLLLMMLLSGANIGTALAAGGDGEGRVSTDTNQIVGEDQDITLNLNDMDLNEVMEMLSSIGRVNILLGKNVSGKVNVNLYNVSLDDAINSIASVSGYSVERRNGTYFIAQQEDLDSSVYAVTTETKTFLVEYSDPFVVEKAVKKYLSPHGMATVLRERRLLVVEDTPAVIRRVAAMIKAIDERPDQVMIEAKILEVTLLDSEVYGINWNKIINSSNGSGSFGLGSIAEDINPSGFFVNFVNRNVQVFLDALESEGRVRTLSAPKLYTMENQDASVIIGERIGYATTTTINAVTTENVEFLESGVILKVRSTVDEDKHILLNVHPEVSTGTIIDGLPAQKTTEVTTQLIVPDGTSVLIGGLMRTTQTKSESGIPFLRSVPGLKWLFGSRENINSKVETLVLITPTIVSPKDTIIHERYNNRVNEQVMIMEESSLHDIPVMEQ